MNACKILPAGLTALDKYREKAEQMFEKTNLSNAFWVTFRLLRILNGKECPGLPNSMELRSNVDNAALIAPNYDPERSIAWQ